MFSLSIPPINSPLPPALKRDEPEPHLPEGSGLRTAEEMTGLRISTAFTPTSSTLKPTIRPSLAAKTTQEKDATNYISSLSQLAIEQKSQPLSSAVDDTENDSKDMHSTASIAAMNDGQEKDDGQDLDQSMTGLPNDEETGNFDEVGTYSQRHYFTNIFDQKKKLLSSCMLIIPTSLYFSSFLPAYLFNTDYDEHYDMSAIDMVSQMPGVTKANLPFIQKAFPTIMHMCAATMETLNKVLGDPNGRILYNFLHNPFKSSLTVDYRM